MEKRSTGLDLSRNKDVECLLDLLDNGMVSDLDEESDDEIIQPASLTSTRVGSDVVHPNEPQPLEENLEDEQEIEEEDDPVVSLSNNCSTNKNTNKPNITWRKHLQFDTSEFSWSSPPISEIESPLTPIEYFNKYILDSLLEEIVFNTNLYANTKDFIFHTIDLAVTNSWLEYKEDCQVCKILHKDILDLLHFRQRVAEALIKMGQPLISRKRGRPSSSGNNSPINTPSRTKSRRCIEFRPASEIQYDTVDHLPAYDKKKKPQGARNQVVKGKHMFVYCLKCDIHLCFVSERRVFEHSAKTHNVYFLLLM